MRYRSTTLALIALMLLTLLGWSGAQAAPVPQKGDPDKPWITDEPAKSTVADKLRVTDPKVIAEIEANIPPLTTQADYDKALVGAKSNYRSFATYSGSYGIYFNGGVVNHGTLFGTSVMGGLALNKPTIGVSHSVYSPIVQMATSCLRVWFQHSAGAGTWTTSHYFVVYNDCTATASTFVVDSTTWPNYILTGNVSSMPHYTQIADKTSQVRFWESNTGTHQWKVDVWDYTTSSYVNFVTYTGYNANAASTSFTFYHTADTTVTSAYCGALGAWNVANTYGIYKYNGSSFVPTSYPTDGAASAGTTTPCLSTSTSVWEYHDNVPLGSGGGYSWTVCGPTETKCR
jgi:hypothetical protein